MAKFNKTSSGLMVPGLTLADRRALRSTAYKLVARVLAGHESKRDVQQLDEINEMLYGKYSGHHDQTAMEEDARAISSRIVGAVTGDTTLVRKLQMPDQVWTTEEAMERGLLEHVVLTGENGEQVGVMSHGEFMDHMKKQDN